MPREPWFDPDSNQARFSQYFERLESWLAAIDDGEISPEEIDRQAERVAGLLRDLEPRLDDELHAALTRVLLELAVLNEMQRVAGEARRDAAG